MNTIKKGSIKTKNKINSIRGSLTVEAALALPLFIYAVVLLCGFFKLVRCQELVQEGITNAARKAAGYGKMVTDLDEFIGFDEFKYADILSNFGLGIYLNEAAGDVYFSITSEDCFDARALRRFGVKDGFHGISFEGSSLKDDEGYTRCECSYTVSLKAPFFGSINIPINQKVKLLSFCGIKGESRFEEVEVEEEKEEEQQEEKEEEQEEEEIVYITETGNKYHAKHDCRHLKVNIITTTFDKVSGLRNESGAKYYNCDRCAKGADPQPSDIVYVTTDGRNYHKSISCGGLKRDIEAVKISEVGNRAPCKSCTK